MLHLCRTNKSRVNFKAQDDDYINNTLLNVENLLRDVAFIKHKKW